MPTAIVDLELTDPGWRATVVSAGRTLVLLRYAGRPVAEVSFDAAADALDVEALERTLLASACGPFWDAWIAAAAGVDRRPAAAPPATIAICTRDRPHELAHCLDSLATLPDDGQEIVVVDSASTTDAVAIEVARRSGIRLVRLERRGLDRARNAALAASQRELVAFVDDDATVEPSWLRALAEPFADPAVAATTGLVLPGSLDTPAQEWFERHFSFGRGYERRRFRRGEPPLEQAWRCGVGASFAVRRETVLHELGGFDETLDVGTPTHGGGDHELFARLLAAGHELEYRPDSVAWHQHVAAAGGLARKFFGYGVSWTALLWRLRPYLGARRVGAELVDSLRRQAGRWRRSRAGAPRSVPARLLAAEAAGWLWGFAAVALSRGTPPPRVAANLAAPRAAAGVATPTRSPEPGAAIDLDLLPGVDAAASALEDAATGWAVVRLGAEPVGVLASAGAAALDGEALRCALAGELAIGLLAAIASGAAPPAGAPALPLSQDALAAWFDALGEEPRFDPDGPFVERFLVAEERHRLRLRWFERAERDIVALAAWNGDIAARLEELKGRFTAVQEELERIEGERLALEHAWSASAPQLGADGEPAPAGETVR